MNCSIYPLNTLRDYCYVVVLSRYQGNILLSQHQCRTTWETQGGHIEPGETPFDAARRELMEESGAQTFSIWPLFDYRAGENGMVFGSEIHQMGVLPNHEMTRVHRFSALPLDLTYPNITPVLFSYESALQDGSVAPTPITVETERLRLRLLTPRQLHLWNTMLPALETELSCSYQGEPLEGFFGRIVSNCLAAAQENPSRYLYHSFWLLIRKEDDVVVGSADFKTLPNQAGDVEIGYGLSPCFEHHGYMTEAVAALCRWALTHNAAAHLVADTDPDGYTSQRVLERCGFQPVPDTLWWRL